MNKKDTYNQGYDTGYDIANANINGMAEFCIESYTQDDLDTFASNMSEFESDVYRQYTPFEFLAHDINECKNSEGLWDSYDNGVYKGILARIKEFKHDNKDGFKKE